MLRNFNGWELLIVLVLVLLLFGVGRITKIAKEMGGGIRAFKEGLQAKDEKAPEEKTEETQEKESKES
jgi:sec-independent protein translocase protein TatA